MFNRIIITFANDLFDLLFSNYYFQFFNKQQIIPNKNTYETNKTIFNRKLTHRGMIKILS